jgi:hypothetical protein
MQVGSAQCHVVCDKGGTHNALNFSVKYEWDIANLTENLKDVHFSCHILSTCSGVKSVNSVDFSIFPHSLATLY